MCAWARTIADGKPVRDSEEARQLLSELAKRFAGDHRDRQRDIDAARTRPHRNCQSCIGRLVDLRGHGAVLLPAAIVSSVPLVVIALAPDSTPVPALITPERR